VIEPTLKKQYMNTRQNDFNELGRMWSNAKSYGERQMIEKTAQKISRESGEVKSMREALFKAHRQGNIGNIKDIHDIVSKKSKYQNE
jgi:hypothetical protein